MKGKIKSQELIEIVLMCIPTPLPILFAIVVSSLRLRRKRELIGCIGKGILPKKVSQMF